MKRVFFLLILLLAASAAMAQTTQGSWTLYPPQTQTYQVTVQQPINPDGTSVWSATKGVVPVQFSLSTAYGPVLFSSLSTGTYSYLSFAPSGPLTFAQIANLTAVYTFGPGNCHGGALRWSITLDGFSSPKNHIFIYYGGTPNFTDCITPGSATNQSGLNMINETDLRFDTSQLGGTFYDSYADALAQYGSSNVTSASLVLDAGWGGDQVVTLGNVTVNDNTFQPLTGSSPTCNLPPANIQVTQLLPLPSGLVDEVTAIQPNDTGSAFRIVDCKYMYNLAAKSLGKGSFEVQAVINDNPVNGSGQFALK